MEGFDVKTYGKVITEHETVNEATDKLIVNKINVIIDRHA